MGFDYALKHILHLLHALGLVIEHALVNVALAKGSLLVGVLDKPVNALCKLLAVTHFEEAVRVEGEVLRGAMRGVGNDRHKAAGDSFKTGNAFELSLGRMAIEVGIVEYLENFLAGEEFHYRLYRPNRGFRNHKDRCRRR